MLNDRVQLCDFIPPLPKEQTPRVVTDAPETLTQWISDVEKRSNDIIPFDQASALPYRYRDGELEFCLITSSSKKKWCFPKGVIDPGETPVETALKEADEEAGVRGEICDRPLGEYSYRKWGRSLRVQVLLMHVQEVATRWDECQLRDRRWVVAEQAAKMLSSGDLRRLLAGAVKRLEKNAVRS